MKGKIMKIKKTNKGFIINYSKEGELVDYTQFTIVETSGKKVKTLYNEIHDCSEIDMHEALDSFFELSKTYDANISIINDLFQVNYCPCCKAEGNPNSVAYIHVNHDFIKNLSRATTDKTLN